MQYNAWRQLDGTDWCWQAFWCKNVLVENCHKADLWLGLPRCIRDSLYRRIHYRSEFHVQPRRHLHTMLNNSGIRNEVSRSTFAAAWGAITCHLHSWKCVIVHAWAVKKSTYCNCSAGGGYLMRLVNRCYAAGLKSSLSLSDVQLLVCIKEEYVMQTGLDTVRLVWYLLMLVGLMPRSHTSVVWCRLRTIYSLLYLLPVCLDMERQTWTNKV